MATNNVKQQRIAGALSATPFGAITGTTYSATKARKGRKLAVGSRTLGRGTAEGLAGGLLASAITRKPAGLPILLGTTGGVYHGSSRAMRNAQKRGDIKKSDGFVSAFGIRH